MSKGFSLDDIRDIFTADMRTALSGIGESVTRVLRTGLVSGDFQLGPSERGSLFLDACSAACDSLPSDLSRELSDGESLILLTADLGVLLFDRLAEAACASASFAMTLRRAHDLIDRLVSATLNGSDQKVRELEVELDELLAPWAEEIEAVSKERVHDRESLPGLFPLARLSEALASDATASDATASDATASDATASDVSSRASRLPCSAKLRSVLGGFPGEKLGEDLSLLSDEFLVVEERCHGMHGSSALISLGALARCSRRLEYFALFARTSSATALGLCTQVSAAANLMVALVDTLHECQDLIGAGMTEEAQRLVECLTSARGVVTSTMAEPLRVISAEDSDSGGDLGPTACQEFEAEAEAEAEVDDEDEEDDWFADSIGGDSIGSEPTPDGSLQAARDPIVGSQEQGDLLGDDSTGSGNCDSESVQEDDELDSFSFESEIGDSIISAGADSAEDMGVDPVLRGIFQEELQQGLIPLQGYLDSLTAVPDQKEVIAKLERVFHTLKGSAATVGLASVSSRALVVEDYLEDALEGRRVKDAAYVVALRAEVNDFLVAAGSAPLVDNGNGDLSFDPLTPELGRVFIQEAREIWSELVSTNRDLAQASLSASEGSLAVEQLRSLSHRLKGSAALNGARVIADNAEEIQRVCGAGSEPSEISELASESIAMIGGWLDAIEGSALQESVASDTVAESADRSGAGSFVLVREDVDIEFDELWEGFSIESSELLEDIERNLILLEQSDQPRTQLEALFRSYHTLKGALNTVGMRPTAAVIHVVEDFLEGLEDAQVLPPVGDVAKFLLRVQDQVQVNLQQVRLGYVETDLASIEATIARLQAGESILLSSGGATGAGVSTQVVHGSSGSVQSGASATSSESKQFIRVPVDKLDKLMSMAGEVVVNRARMRRRVESLGTLGRDLDQSRMRLVSTVEMFREEYEFAGVVGGSHSARQQAFSFSCESPGEAIARGNDGARGNEGARGDDGSAASDGSDGFSALEMDRYEDVNILARSLHEVSNDFSEVLSQITTVLDDFAEDTEVFGAITTDLQDQVTQLRMVPMDQLFMRLRRPVRDAAEREQREVRVVVQGEEEILDKNIIDALYKPMTHLVRNSVCHGIESGDRRLSAGKDRVGTITLSAKTESGRIIIEVHDDGAGLDLPALHKKGVERGLIPPETALDSPLVHDLVFARGLSSRDEASDVAGRGIGCDVLQEELQRLNGEVSVHSEKDKGTTFRLSVPLTLAIFKALIVRERGQEFAIPLNFADRTLELDGVDVLESGGTRRVKLDGSFLSLEGLGTALDLPCRPDSEESNRVVLLSVGDQRLALRVDDVIGQEEIVVRGLGALLQGHPMYSGVTISGDGELVLILDVPGLFRAKRGDVGVAPGSRGAISASAASPGKMGQAVGRRPGGGRARVLWVDDSLSVRKAAEMLLKSLDVEVVLARDGMDAIERIRDGEYDFVFTDLEMPKMSGYDLIRELRYIPAFKDLPIVVVTSRSGEKHRTQAEKVGATGYLTKPFNRDDLIEKLSCLSCFEAPR